MPHRNEHVICALSGAKVSRHEASQGFTIRPSVMNLIKVKVPTFDRDSWILNKYLKEFKLQYVQTFAADEHLNEIAANVAKAVATHDFLAVSYLDTVGQSEETTAYDRAIDKIANFGGSLWFVFGFLTFVLLWAVLNTFAMRNGGFDQYPYVFLNLLLGCIASLQAPFIMMSQNKTSREDRRRAENDYKVNLKSEFELSILREKIDHVINNQNPYLQELLVLQAEQIEELKELLAKK